MASPLPPPPLHSPQTPLSDQTNCHLRDLSVFSFSQLILWKVPLHSRESSRETVRNWDQHKEGWFLAIKWGVSTMRRWVTTNGSFCWTSPLGQCRGEGAGEGNMEWYLQEDKGIHHVQVLWGVFHLKGRALSTQRAQGVSDKKNPNSGLCLPYEDHYDHHTMKTHSTRSWKQEVNQHYIPHVCIHTNAQTRIYILIHKHTHINVYTYLYIHTHVYAYTYTCVNYINTYTHLHIHMHMIHIYKWMNMHTCIHEYSHTCVYTHIDTCIHVHKYTYTHKYTYIHRCSKTFIHMHIQVQTQIYNKYIYIQVHICMHMHMYMHIYMHIHIYLHTFRYMYTQKCEYMHTDTEAYIHIYSDAPYTNI